MQRERVKWEIICLCWDSAKKEKVIACCTKKGFHNRQNKKEVPWAWAMTAGPRQREPCLGCQACAHALPAATAPASALSLQIPCVRLPDVNDRVSRWRFRFIYEFVLQSRKIYTEGDYASFYMPKKNKEMGTSGRCFPFIGTNMRNQAHPRQSYSETEALRELFLLSSDRIPLSFWIMVPVISNMEQGK